MTQERYLKKLNAAKKLQIVRIGRREVGKGFWDEFLGSVVKPIRVRPGCTPGYFSGEFETKYGRRFVFSAVQFKIIE